MGPPTLGEMAESVTPETLPVLFDRLRNRPEPRDLTYESLIIELAAETLNRKPFSVFREYSDLTGARMPETAERLWKISYPGVLEIKPKIPQTAAVIDFPMDRLRERNVTRM